MRIEVELSHIDNNRIVVKATVYDKQYSLGSSFGQGDSVNEAENNAISRILGRLKSEDEIYIEKKSTQQINLNPSKERPEKATINKKKNIDNNNKINKIDASSSNYSKEPEDWSKELAFIDNELKRIGWNKEDENNFINKLLGYTNRNRITTFKHLKILLLYLKDLENGSNQNDIIISKDNLIEKTNFLIKQLSWDEIQGRNYLMKNFNKNSRNELSKIQLLEFIIDLSEINDDFS